MILKFVVRRRRRIDNTNIVVDVYVCHCFYWSFNVRHIYVSISTQFLSAHNLLLFDVFYFIRHVIISLFIGCLCIIN